MGGWSSDWEYEYSKYISLSLSPPAFYHFIFSQVGPEAAYNNAGGQAVVHHPGALAGGEEGHGAGRSVLQELQQEGDSAGRLHDGDGQVPGQHDQRAAALPGEPRASDHEDDPAEVFVIERIMQNSQIKNNYLNIVWKTAFIYVYFSILVIYRNF